MVARRARHMQRCMDASHGTHAPSLHHAFTNVTDEAPRRTRGTGIGLALVQGLAEQMGARASARNHPEGGLEFELRLPR